MRNMIAVLFVVALSGCCTCADGYKAFLGQIGDNLQNDIRPKYERALRMSGRPADLMVNDLGLVDDTVSSIARVVSGADPQGESR